MSNLVDDFMFASPEDALQLLMNEILIRHLDTKNTLMLVTSLKGLKFAHVLARRLNTPLDFLFTAPIYAPLNRECEIALVSESMDILMNENLINSFEITLDYVYGEAKRVYEEEILSKIYKYRKGNTIKSLENKNVFIVDCGIETGITANLAIQTCMAKSSKNIYVLTPILPKSVADALALLCDGVISVYRPEYFVSIEHYYKTPIQIEPAEIEAILKKIEEVQMKGTDAKN
ncbi:Phosphoribosyltransferase [Helicobacter sp. NHP19-003]|uniref:Phosphoribosyltransferase n=1 Tax=Helicobacter gastrocanis TaxID=2849641 RepID=A0ABN6I353_9HELI|nr:phosphoribosyltransferase [Helicobacter sp. NHP19-003]BCZ17422.1 Phosphoribosyltransferase [Helicobacter sp. NHP19-003]